MRSRPSRAISIALFGSALVGAAAIAISCATSPKGTGFANMAGARAPASDKPYSETITSAEQFDSLAVAAGGLIHDGRATKFVIDLRPKNGGSQSDPEHARIYYVNGNYQSGGKVPDSQLFHYYFTQRWLENQMDSDEFNRVTYFNDTLPERLFVAGTIQTYQLQKDGQNMSFYGIQFYPQDLIKEETALFAIRQVFATFKVPDAELAFVAYGQQQTVDTVRSQLGIRDYTVDQLLGNQPYVVMNPGEAWGFLRVKPANPDELTPLDIPVFDQLPLDLSVVAGVVTYQAQDAGSHINLKSKERKTPDVVVRDAKLRAELEALDGQPVHLVANGEGGGYATPMPSSKEEVEKRYKDRVLGKWEKLRVKKNVSLMAFDDMCPQDPKGCLDNSAYGGKASKLGFLANPKVLGRGQGSTWAAKNFKYRLTPIGFAIPLEFYQTYVKGNPELAKALDEFTKKEMTYVPITKEEQQARSAERSEQLAKIQQLFYSGRIPPAMLAKLKASFTRMVSEVQAEYTKEFPEFKLKKVKVRSSGNAEDIPDFDGAGLHDSFGADVKRPDTLADTTDCKLEASSDVETKGDMNPDTFTCALKGVYASLWNKRAVEERSFRHLDHTTAAMGAGVHPSYGLLKKFDLDESGNSVLITRVLNTHHVYGYTVSSQLGESLVTNPTPGTQTEVAVATFLSETEPIGLTYTQFSKPEPGGPVMKQPVFSAETMRTMVKIAQHVEKAYCYAKPDYDPSSQGDCSYALIDVDKPRALDMEFKVLGPNQERIMCKQMREFSGE